MLKLKARPFEEQTPMEASSHTDGLAPWFDFAVYHFVVLKQSIKVYESRQSTFICVVD